MTSIRNGANGAITWLVARRIANLASAPPEGVPDLQTRKDFLEFRVAGLATGARFSVRPPWDDVSGPGRGVMGDGIVCRFLFPPGQLPRAHSRPMSRETRMGTEISAMDPSDAQVTCQALGCSPRSAMPGHVSHASTRRGEMPMHSKMRESGSAVQSGHFVATSPLAVPGRCIDLHHGESVSAGTFTLLTAWTKLPGDPGGLRTMRAAPIPFEGLFGVVAGASSCSSQFSRST
jgi:hypothetical protein